MSKCGDWRCTCGDLNNSSRVSCRSCGNCRTVEVPSPTSSSPRGSASDEWVCSCRESNAVSRMACRRCGLARASTPTSQSPKPSQTPPASASPRGGGPGDWKCSCTELNAASRMACRKCGIARASTTSQNPSPSAPLPPGSKYGHWECSCKELNLVSLLACRKCGLARANASTPQIPNPQIPKPSRIPPASASPRGGGSGDWKCSCKELNAASLLACRKCGIVRASTPTSQNPSPSAPLPQRSKEIYWECSCKMMNRANLLACRKCGLAHANASTSQSPNPSIPPASASPRGGGSGDWKCSCKELNAASLSACRKCGLTRSSTRALETSETDSAGVPQNPGDWKCVNCSKVQLASRLCCSSCRASKPLIPTKDSSHPENWDPMIKNLELFLLSDGSEMKEIAAKFKKTMPRATLKSIHRIQNKMLWKKFNNEKELMTLAGNSTTEILFHGTRGTKPEMIYNGQEGFDMRMSNAGNWGVATYFAVNASYSDGYSYSGSHSYAGNCDLQMFAAQVLVGNSVDYGGRSDRSLRLPPEIKTQPVSSSNDPSNGPAVRRYDSVTGTTGGSKVFMIYANGKAYPEYLITYSR